MVYDYEYNIGSMDATEERLDKLVAEKIKPNWQVQTHPLMGVFQAAVAQATSGKGEERHGKGSSFMDQPWVDLAKTHGIGFLTGQADKKLREASKNFGIGSDEWWEKEMLGALNYIAMAILYKKGIK